MFIRIYVSIPIRMHLRLILSRERPDETGNRNEPDGHHPSREAKAWAVRRGVNLSATFSAYLAAMMRADLDGAGKPGSDDGPVQGTTRPKPKGAKEGVRGGG